jgi:hypothetical protein
MSAQAGQARRSAGAARHRLRQELCRELPHAGQANPADHDRNSASTGATPAQSATLRVMTTTHAHSPYTALPDEQSIADTVVALEERGFSDEVVNDLDSARDVVLSSDPRWLLRNDEYLGDAARERHRGGDRRGRTV